MYTLIHSGGGNLHCRWPTTTTIITGRCTMSCIIIILQVGQYATQGLPYGILILYHTCMHGYECKKFVTQYIIILWYTGVGCVYKFTVKNNNYASYGCENLA